MYVHEYFLITDLELIKYSDLIQILNNIII